MLYPQSENDDLRATIEASYETEAKTTPEPEVVEEPVAETPEEPEAKEEPGDHPTDPARRADGKFKPQKTEAAPEKAAPETETTPSKDDQAKASEPAAQTAALNPPAGWTAVEKAEWSKLPPAIQAAVSRREAEMANGGKQWSEEKRRYETTLAPVAQAAARRGMRTEEGLQALMRAQDFLDQDAPNAIKWLAKSYNVDLATLAGQPAEVQSEARQPDISRLVQQAVMPYLAPIQERMQMEERQKQESTVNLVTQFAESPGHEHFNAVENELMGLIPAIKSANPSWSHEKILQDAYDRAVYANPTTRAAVLAAQQAEADAKRQADVKARAASARRASVSVTGAPSGNSGRTPKDSLRAELEAAFSGE